MTKRKKVAIIGSSQISKFHIDAFRKASVDIISCASSPNSKNIKNFANENKIDQFFYDPFELIYKNNWDGLIISSSVRSIPNILKASIKFHKPILVEKPVDYGTKYLKKLNFKKLDFVNVAYNRRFYSTVKFAKLFIQKSSGGCTLSVRIPEQVNIFKKNKSIKFHNVYNNSCHMIDLIQFLIGKVQIIKILKNPLNRNARLALLKSGKNYCQLIINSNSPDNFSIQVENGKQRLELRPLEKLFLYEGMEVKDPTLNFPLRTYSPKIKYSSDIFDGKNINLIKPGFFEQALDFKRLLNGKKSIISAKLEDAYLTQQFINKLI